MPKVSVVLPCYNVEQYVRECLESALAQTLKDIEIICVNDGSTDNTLAILQEYAQKDVRVKVIDKENSGYGSSMNCGVDAATGEYIAILETDDCVKSHMYETLYKMAHKHNLDVIKSDYEIFLGEGNQRSYTYMRTCRKYSQYRKVIDPEKRIDVFNARMNTWTGLYKRSFLLENGIRHNETPGASYQDNGFWFQTFLWAKRLMFLNKAFYQLRRDNPNSSVHSKEKVFCIFDEYAFIERILRANPEKEKTFIRIFQKKKFDNCLYHYSRIGDEFKVNFLCRMRNEFSKARDAGELDPLLFVGNGYSTLCEIINNPQLYYVRTAGNIQACTLEDKIQYFEFVCAGLKSEIETLSGSYEYRIGRAVTFLPRKIQGGILCIKDNGLHYTIVHFFEKIQNTLNGR